MIKIFLWTIATLVVGVFANFFLFPFIKMKFFLWKSERMVRKLAAKHTGETKYLLNKLAGLFRAERKNEKL